jgi:hypothetical protein
MTEPTDRSVIAARAAVSVIGQMHDLLRDLVDRRSA